VVVDLGDVAPVYGALENVGGALLAEVYALLEPAGSVQSIGMASLEPATIDFEQARLRGGGRIEAFNVFSHGGAFGGDLAQLLKLVARGELDPQVGLARIMDADYHGRRCFPRKAGAGQTVLEVDDTD
jgi:NADPH:quinone reductase